MKKINHKEMKTIAKNYSGLNRSLVVFGRTGIGKSYGVKQVAKKQAKI